MAFSFSGRAAQGAHDNLQELLAAQLAEEMARADQAQRDRQIGQTDRRLGLDEQQHALDVRGQDFVEKERGADIEQESMDKMRAHQSGVQGRLDLIQQQQDQDEAIAGLPDDVRPTLSTLIKLGGKPSGADLRPQETPEEKHQRELETIEAREAAQARHRAPSEGSKQWLVRDGQEVYDTYRQGDTRAKTTSGSGVDPAKGAAQITAALNALESYSKKVNTNDDGFVAEVAGAGRSFAGRRGYDNDVRQYEKLLSGFMPLLARAVGHVGVLTQQDVDSVRDLLPKPGDTKSLAEENFVEIKKILNAAGASELLGGRAPVTAEMPEGGAAPGGGDAAYAAYLASRKRK